MSYPDVTMIIFDEFIIDKGTYKYLSDEVTCFLEFYETVARIRDVQVFFLSNAITITNPYFLYWNLKMPYNSDITCKNDMLIQLVANPFFIDMKKNTRFGRLISGTVEECKAQGIETLTPEQIERMLSAWQPKSEI